MRLKAELGRSPDQVFGQDYQETRSAAPDIPSVSFLRGKMAYDLRILPGTARIVIFQKGRWRRLFTAGAVVAGMMAGSGVEAANFAYSDGNTLYAECTNQAFYVGCLGYIEGINDAMAMIEFAGHSEGLVGYKRCLSARVSAGQLGDVVVQFLAAHPANRHLPAANLVAQALSEAFSCR
jgi:hypothetical protein